MPTSHRKLPDTASIAIPDKNGKLHAPSAVRNVDSIVQAIGGFAPASGKALEIASGTGEHVVRFAAAFPNISWQPTDIAAERLDSIAAWSADADLSNIRRPRLLDACVAGWATDWAGQDLIILSNLLHLISEGEARTVISQSARVLANGGVMLIYGPFLRGTDFASESDRSFHQSLRSSDAEIGYKSFQSIQSTLSGAGLEPSDPIEMPANNLFLAARKD